LAKGVSGRRAIGRIIRHARLRALPAIMETPVANDPDDDLMNLATARRLDRNVK